MKPRRSTAGVSTVFLDKKREQFIKKVVSAIAGSIFKRNAFREEKLDMVLPPYLDPSINHKPRSKREHDGSQ